MAATATCVSLAPGRTSLAAVGVPPPPPSPTGAPAPSTVPPPPRRPSSRWVLPVALGCGLVIVVLAVGGVLAYRYFTPRATRTVREVARATSAPVGPSEAAAAFAALQEVPGRAVVIKHADDWTTATINVIPEGGRTDQAVPVTLTWNEATRAYDTSIPVGSDVAPDEVKRRDLNKPLLGDGRPSPSGGGSAEAARAKALTMCPDKTWVVEVSKHESDWSGASVKIGADADHFVAEIDLIWDADGKDYRVVDTRSLVGQNEGN